MKVIGLCGPSGVGKTRLAEGLIRALKDAGQRVSVVKHAHKRFDIDHPGKDSWRHREAGAFEVVVANAMMLAKVRSYEAEGDPSVHQLLAELVDTGEERNWAVVEGFKHAGLPKIEVWRAALGQAPLYPTDPFVVAVATDDPAALPEPTSLPVLDLNDPPAVAAFLLHDPRRYDYRFPDDA